MPHELVRFLCYHDPLCGDCVLLRKILMLGLLLLFMVPWGAAQNVAAQNVAAQNNAAKITLLKAGRLLDVRAGKYLVDQGVLIEGERIQEVGPFAQVRAHAPKDAVVIDLGGAAVLPGLIDCHAHLLDAMGLEDEALLQAVAGMSVSRRALLGARMAREELEGGFTTVRVLGHSGIDGDAALRDAVNEGWVMGPRILASCRKLAPPGGQLMTLNPAVAKEILEQEFLIVGSADEARAAVRQNRAYGADGIKVVADPEGRFLTLGEMKAIVEEAHRSGMKVAVHANTVVGIQAAIDARVDSIEHGDDVTDEQLKAMREAGIFLDITPFSGGRLRGWLRKNTPLSRRSRFQWEKNDQQSGAARLRRVLQSGVKYAAGSDMWFEYPGKTRGEATATMYGALLSLGMEPVDIVRAGTMRAAELIGWQDRVGVIEAGKFADIVATSGDPLRDIGDLEQIGFVMKGGVVVRNSGVGK